MGNGLVHGLKVFCEPGIIIQDFLFQIEFPRVTRGFLILSIALELSTEESGRTSE